MIEAGISRGVPLFFLNVYLSFASFFLFAAGSPLLNPTTCLAFFPSPSRSHSAASHRITGTTWRWHQEKGSQWREIVSHLMALCRPHWCCRNAKRKKYMRHKLENFNNVCFYYEQLFISFFLLVCVWCACLSLLMVGSQLAAWRRLTPPPHHHKFLCLSRCTFSIISRTLVIWCDVVALSSPGKCILHTYPATGNDFHEIRPLDLECVPWVGRRPWVTLRVFGRNLNHHQMCWPSDSHLSAVRYVAPVKHLSCRRPLSDSRCMFACCLVCVRLHRLCLLVCLWPYHRFVGYVCLKELEKQTQLVLGDICKAVVD